MKEYFKFVNNCLWTLATILYMHLIKLCINRIHSQENSTHSKKKYLQCHSSGDEVRGSHEGLLFPQHPNTHCEGTTP